MSNVVFDPTDPSTLHGRWLPWLHNYLWTRANEHAFMDRVYEMIKPHDWSLLWQSKRQHSCYGSTVLEADWKKAHVTVSGTIDNELVCCCTSHHGPTRDGTMMWSGFCSCTLGLARLWLKAHPIKIGNNTETAHPEAR